MSKDVRVHMWRCSMRDGMKASDRRAIVARLHGDTAMHVDYYHLPYGEDELGPASAPVGSSAWAWNVLLRSVAVGIVIGSALLWMYAVVS